MTLKKGKLTLRRSRLAAVTVCGPGVRVAHVRSRGCLGPRTSVPEHGFFARRHVGVLAILAAVSRLDFEAPLIGLLATGPASTPGDSPLWDGSRNSDDDREPRFRRTGRRSVLDGAPRRCSRPYTRGPVHSQPTQNQDRADAPTA